MNHTSSATKEDIYRLLDRVGELQRYQARVRLEHATDFNFFTAVTAWHDENAHTRILTALLDPNGKHGQGTLFLRLFLQHVGVVEEADIPSMGEFKVSAQHYISGTKNLTQRNRYPDLIVEGPDEVVVIENKVRAGESEDQLPDYGRWLAHHWKTRRILIFLTPEGHPPEQIPSSVSQDGIEIRRMAYAEATDKDHATSRDSRRPEDRTSAASGVEFCGHLSDWLDSCLSHVPLLPPVREVISQYRNLVDRIGGHTVSNHDQDAVAHLASEDSKNFAAAIAVSDATRLAKAKVQHRFWMELAHELGSEFSTVLPKDNSEAEIKRYLTPGISNRPRPGLQLLTELQWRKEPLYIELELLPNTDKNWLTIKLLRPLRDDAYLDSEDQRILDKVQHTQRSSLPIADPASPRRSFLVGRLTLKNGSQLDLTNFDPPAHKLADQKERSEIIKEVCDATREFYGTVDSIVSELVPA